MPAVGWDVVRSNWTARFQVQLQFVWFSSNNFGQVTRTWEIYQREIFAKKGEWCCAVG